MKQCSNCGIVKAFSDYTLLKITKKTTSPIYRSVCKSCYSWKKRCKKTKAINKILDLPGEIWKDIPGFENVYLISNKGRVKSLNRLTRKISHGAMYFTSEILMKTHIQSGGYLKVTLKKPFSKEYKNYTIHRLVAIAFLDNSQNLREVNHIDGIKTNNTVENLEWISSRNNKLHAINLGLSNPTLNLPWNIKS